MTNLAEELGLKAEGLIPSKDGSPPWFSRYVTDWEKDPT